MKKQLLSLVLMMLPLAVSAISTRIDGICYILDSKNKTAQVAQWNSGVEYAGDIVIPSTVVKREVEYTVTSIMSRAFYDCDELTSVTIPNTVTSIGSFIFEGCKNLASIVVEEGNPTYDSRENCNALIETANNRLITGCNGTTIPNSITTIEQEAFKGFTGLTTLIIPDGVTTIKSDALRDCSGLTYVYLGKGLVNIPECLFQGCDNLKTIEINNNALVSRQQTGNENGNMISIQWMLGNSSVEEIILGEDVTSIGDNAFSGCGMHSIKMSDSVTSIGDYAFNGCSQLTSIELSNNLEYIGKWAFTICERLPSITIPESVRCIDQIAFYWCNRLTKVEINSNEVAARENEQFYTLRSCFGPQVKEFVFGENVKKIAWIACSESEKLTTVTISSNLTCIDLIAFYWCNRLTKVEINSNEVVARENEQFYTLTSCFGKQVKEFVFGEDVKKIAWIACSESENLTTVTISSNLTCVEDSAFHKCTSLADMYCYAEQVPEMGKDVFVDSNYKNATLHVPAASVEAYRNAEQWKDFGNIVALTDEDPKPTGISTMEYAPMATNKAIYDLQGHQLTQPKRGLNIIRMSDGKTRKVIVK